MSRFASLGSNRKFASCPTSGYDKVVPNLAVSPTQMAELTSRGIPISSQTIGQTEYVDDSRSMAVDPINQRGMSRVELWNLSEDSKSRILRAHKSDIATFDKVRKLNLKTE